jgi:hypothetical protein
MANQQRERVNLVSAHECAQVTLKTCDAMRSCIADAIDTAFALHNRSNGSTVSLVQGNMADKKLFSVSINPERTIELWERPTWQELFEFAKANLDLLQKPGYALGTWFDDWKQVRMLDVANLVADRDAALALALRYGQVAIFDLGLHREIAVSRPSENSLAQRAGGVNA